MKAKSYILTRQHNEYDQFGEYFVAWFQRKPNLEEINAAFIENDEGEINNALAVHVLGGGGRIGIENVWWRLREVKSGNV